MKPFYVVWEPDSGYTKFKHEDKRAAITEAERLALAHPTKTFIVLRSVSISKQKTVDTQHFNQSDEYQELEDEIPF